MYFFNSCFIFFVIFLFLFNSYFIFFCNLSYSSWFLFDLFCNFSFLFLSHPRNCYREFSFYRPSYPLTLLLVLLSRLFVFYVVVVVFLFFNTFDDLPFFRFFFSAAFDSLPLLFRSFTNVWLFPLFSFFHLRFSLFLFFSFFPLRLTLSRFFVFSPTFDYFPSFRSFIYVSLCFFLSLFLLFSFFHLRLTSFFSRSSELVFLFSQSLRSLGRSHRLLISVSLSLLSPRALINSYHISPFLSS